MRYAPFVVTPTPDEPTLLLRDVRRAFGARTVLAGTSIEQRGAGIVGLVGANGAGKTTLLRIIAQLVEADAGTVEVCGRRVERGDDPQARRAVGWAPHEPLAWRDDTVLENLRYAARLAGEPRRSAHELASGAIAAWQLEAVEQQPVRVLSRGWAQRYSLARADLLRPPVLLLDEPTTGLDPAARTRLEQAVAQWRSTRIVVVASHERDWLTTVADQIVELVDGSVR